jgi:tRNA nucleotidyltransferase (CCA-adding enzyme)
MPMDVILTHEQADFDAMGAMLGAFLMNEKAYPVFPRRMNRNVRAFLTLYGAELPFVDVRDLPNEPIETVTLVDTQSLVTLKGMSRRTLVHVVDHHQLRADLPENWNVTIDNTGACTTLFVEGLREHNGTLTAVHSTLLLLGIYEDTGSLSYAGTTPRDVRAAAFLLEQGGSLQILSRYINPPLSDDQRQVYERLLQRSEHLHIHGQDVLIAQASAEDMSEEISTIAHKMRDLLDPDALFLLVHTPEGIRLVARSVTDNIDVSKVAEHFGGGGHGRAAAALLRQASETSIAEGTAKKPTLEEVYAQLVEVIPQHVQPSLTVRQIMSPRPLVLPPDTPAEKAAHLMQRYGYEGYPVVEKGKVKGLLTRRSVDRALAHRLNLTASSLMESGEVQVHPYDSIEHLRRVMIDSGWGQIPVTDPESGDVIGIVTRTDLLKNLIDTAPPPGRQNLASRLEEGLSPARLALLRKIAAKAHEQRLAVYVVGGFVRDLLLNRPSPDFDLVVEGDAIALANVLSRCCGGRTISHSRFGTAKWNIADDRPRLAAALADETGGRSPDAPIDADELPESLDMISARTEFYDYPTALPTVERSSIKLDLHRRDFTINTMALRLDGRHYGELYDYWGGLRDLRSGLVRVLHSLSFVDDPTRMMRAVRFEQRFGFKIEERTCQLISEAREMIRQVSGDRLRHELSLILSEERAAAMLKRLEELQLLNQIHPALSWSKEDQDRMASAVQNAAGSLWALPEKMGSIPLQQALRFMAWLVKYSSEDALSIADRLRLPGSIQDVLAAVKKLQADLPQMTNAPPSQITSRLDEVPPAALYLVDLLQPSEEARQILHNYRQTWSKISAHTNGDTLREMQLQPGPHYRWILSALRAAWLDGEIHTIEEEKDLLDSLVQNLPDFD